VVGAQVGTAFVDALKKTGLFSESRSTTPFRTSCSDVNAGRLKAGFDRLPILAYNLKQVLLATCGWWIPTSQSPSARFRFGIRKSDSETAGQDQRLARQAQGQRQPSTRFSTDGA